MRNGYGCHSFNVGSSKRGDAACNATLIAQEGYTFVFKGANGVVERKPILVEYKSEWLDIACGYVGRTGDKQCSGCANQLR